ncbi:hypothetical protein DYB30_011848, partial [Aphanomyces astaci]
MFAAIEDEEVEDADSNAFVFHATDSRGRVLVDSGASTHMTGDATRLTDLMPCDRTVIVANGGRTRATKMGTMRVTTDTGATLVMEDVLVIDAMPSTLLSVTAMMRRDSKFAVTFNARGCSIMHGTNTIATATLDPRRKVYVLDLAGEVEQCNLAADTPAKKSTQQMSTLWHQRVGHLPTAAVNRCGSMGLGTPKQLPELKVKCECCAKNKITKISPPKERTRSFRPGECWVSDTKGPMRTESATKCVMMGYAEAQKAYKLYDLEHQKMVTSVQVEFRENEFPGVRTPIDEYLVTHDDDDDDDEELTQGEPVATKPTSTPVTTSQPRMAPPSHFKPGKRVTSTPTPRGMSTQAHFYPDSIVDGAVGGRPLSALTPPATSRRDTMMTMDEFNSPPSDYRGMALRDRNKIRVPARFDGESARRSNTKQVANVIRDLDAATGRDRANAATEVELGATMTVDGVEYACSALPTMDDIPQSHHEAMRNRIALANERGLAASNDGNVTTPARTNTHDPAYSDDNDAYALGILLTCCSESQQQYVAEVDTYGEAWCALVKHHEPKTRVDRLATLSEYFNMKWNTKQESLPQFLERYEIVLRKLKASGDAVHDSMVVDRLLDMLPWQMRAVTHQVHAMPMAQSQNLATVRVLLEAEYKAAIRSGALTNPKSGNNDDHALLATVKPGKCNWCQHKGHWEAECRSKQAGRPRRPKENNPKGNSGKKDQNKEDSGNLALDEEVWMFAAIEDEE